jgi:hypothetical protein
MLEKPPVLYHGSPYLFDEAMPSFSTPTTDPRCRKGVYASGDRRIALVFALRCRESESGTVQRPRCWRKQNEVFIAVAHGTIDWNATGFLYHLPPATFSCENGWEWRSTTSVIPIYREAVKTVDFLSVVAQSAHETLYEVSEHAYDIAA